MMLHTGTLPCEASDPGLPQSLQPTLTTTVATGPVTFINGVAPGDSYWFIVAGINKDGDVGPYSKFEKQLLVPDALTITTNKCALA